jgi:hypothetical protein
MKKIKILQILVYIVLSASILCKILDADVFVDGYKDSWNDNAITMAPAAGPFDSPALITARR